MNGYVHLHRRIMDSDVWKRPEYLRVWLTLLLKANYAPSVAMGAKGKPLPLPAGTVLTSREDLMRYSRATERVVRNSLDCFVALGMITRETTKSYTLIKIVNWGNYQQTSPADAQPKASDSPEKVQPEVPQSAQQTDQPEAPQEAHQKAISKKEIINKTSNTPLTPLVAATAKKIVEQHPAGRRCSEREAASLITQILARNPSLAGEELLAMIDRNHTDHCASADWKREDGRFVPQLANWLNPEREKYLISMAPPKPPAPRYSSEGNDPYAIWVKPEWMK